MASARINAAAPLLVVEAGLAAVATFFYYVLTAEYGDVTASALENLSSGFGAGFATVGLVLVGGTALVVVVLSSHRSVRLIAAGIAVLMPLGMLAVTPTALTNKLDSQYQASPQCWWEAEEGEGPGTEAARSSQVAFDSIEHVGYFSGGGAVGVGGCDAGLVVLDDTDVVQHYRTALPDAGWQVVEDDGQRLRAERGDMAFEVVMCSSSRGGVWAGEIAYNSPASCAGG
jgi:hypothetical protein